MKFPAFEEPEDSLPHSQEPAATCPGPEPDQSSPCSHIPHPEDAFYYYPPPKPTACNRKNELKGIRICSYIKQMNRLMLSISMISKGNEDVILNSQFDTSCPLLRSL
jgi:hypothetical protein